MNARPMPWQRELDLAARAARAAATLLRETFTTDAGVRSSDGKDIKTRADVEAEAQILRALAPTGMPVIAEESANAGRPPDGPHWLVDPLDGTMNFSRGFPMHAVSIGLWDAGKPVLGVIVDIARDALYAGVVGVGAHRDGKPIRVSAVADPGQALLATGFPTGRDYGSDALTTFVGRVQAFKKIRMIGSAAMSLAMVAQGSFDGYHEEDIMLWDVAAGLALVAAAGGRIDTRPGAKPLSVAAAATNGLIVI
jgi:myo-inositol-1(or 4)-monophosphatase